MTTGAEAHRLGHGSSPACHRAVSCRQGDITSSLGGPGLGGAAGQGQGWSRAGRWGEKVSAKQQRLASRTLEVFTEAEEGEAVAQLKALGKLQERLAAARAVLRQQRAAEDVDEDLEDLIKQLESLRGGG
jgi:hypothetical protein